MHPGISSIVCDPSGGLIIDDCWTVEQVYWLVTHGVGDTGMPGFGSSDPDQQRWAIAYFVKQLPQMTPEEFRKLVAQ